MKNTFHILTILFALAVQAFAADKITAASLIAESPIIAIIEIGSVPNMSMNDASNDLSISKQRATAHTIQKIKGNIPDTFTIENQRNSILSQGKHLAFLRLVIENRYILTTASSLRKITDDKVYWFPGFISLSDVIPHITAQQSTEQGAAANP